MKKRLLVLGIFVFVAFLCVWSGISLYQSKYSLTVTQYSVTTAVLKEIRIVQLSDLHGMVFGEGNEELIEAVLAQSPDIIAMTGDMFSTDTAEEQIDSVCHLVCALCDIAPLYYSLGNHEIAHIEEQGDSYLSRLEESGAVILEQSYVDIEINGQALRIGGCYGYLLSRKYRNEAEQDFMNAFLDTDSATVLLAHMPEGLLDYDCIDDWDVDIVLSGHTHGGQVRLPLIGGVYDPEVGWFPEYESGLFQRGDSAVIVSAGLGSSSTIPRFYNVPEIVVINLCRDTSI